MRRATITAVLLLTAAAAHAQFVAPVLKGIKGDGTPRQTNGPIPFPAADEKWLLARSKHFVFISSADESRTRSVAAELETLASALTQADSTFSAPAATPTRVILFTRRRESRPYFDMLLNRRDANVSGVFVAQREGGSMLINQDYSWQGGDRAPLHELIHYLMQSGDAHAPLWLEEGIAEYFSNATIRARSISAGEPMSSHIAVLRDLAANSADPAGRRGLETQAAEVTRVAAQNRQISDYNKIIAQVNSGKYHDARKR
jgi:hypothetical protein